MFQVYAVIGGKKKSAFEEAIYANADPVTYRNCYS